jgi:hypothetical protein
MWSGVLSRSFDVDHFHRKEHDMNALIESFGQQRAQELRAEGSRRRLAARLRWSRRNR